MISVRPIANNGSWEPKNRIRTFRAKNKHTCQTDSIVDPARLVKIYHQEGMAGTQAYSFFFTTIAYIKVTPPSSATVFLANKENEGPNTLSGSSSAITNVEKPSSFNAVKMSSRCIQ